MYLQIVRTILNTTFNFFSRSFILTAVFLLSVVSVYAAPNLEYITAEGKTGTVEVNVGDNYTISWRASEFGGCYFQESGPLQDDNEEGWSAGSGSVFSSRYVTSDNDPGQTYTYTLTCYKVVTSVRPLLGSTIPLPIPETYTDIKPYFGDVDLNDIWDFSTFGSGESVTKTVQVKIVDTSTTDCPTSGYSAESIAKCNQVCSNYPSPAAVCNSCKNNPDGPLCKQSCTEPDVLQCKQDQETANQTTTPTIADTEGSRCFPGIVGGAGFSATGCFIEILDVTAVPLAASFLQLCAYIFEFTIQISIVQFSNLVSGTGSGDWLTAIWRTIRDILNIFVIFILLYSAIKVIVGQGGEIKKLISGVILFGVLTNFSLFLTKAAVDLSNIVALEFYQQMRNAPLSEAVFSNGLGATIVGVTGLTNLYDPEGAISGGKGTGISATTTARVSNTPLQDSSLYRIAMIFVFIAAAFVFLQAAFIFLARTLSIILLLIFSPLMFAGGVFSPLKEWIDKWWKDFLGQITLAPIFMILLYVVLTILGSLVKTTNARLQNDSDIYSLLGLIILTSSLTIFGFSAVINKSREYSSTIGEKGVSKALGWGARAAGLVGGFVGRNTMGRIGKSLLSGDSAPGNALRESAAKNTWTGRNISRNVLRAAGSASKSEFDVRSSPVGSGIGKIIDASNKYTKGNVQIDAGKATTSGGFAGRLKKDTEEQTKQDVATLKEREGLLKAEGDTRAIKDANSARKKAFGANGGYNRDNFEKVVDVITGRSKATTWAFVRAGGQSVREDAIEEFKKKSKKSKNEDELKIWKKDLLRYTKFGTEPDEKFLPDDVEVGGKKVGDYTSKNDLEDALVELDEIDTKKLWEKMQGEAEAAPATNSKRSKALQRAKAAPSQISKLAEAIEKEERVEEKKKENKEKEGKKKEDKK